MQELLKEDLLKEDPLEKQLLRLQEIYREQASGKVIASGKAINGKKGGVVLMGAQWGDEGKGKATDVYSNDADAVVRYAGGPNAAHTVRVADREIILKQIPSGVMNPNAQVVLAPGMAIQPHLLYEEMKTVPPELGLEGRLHISDKAHLITPMQVDADIKREKSGRGNGSTRNGISPCYEDRVGRRGLRLGDFLFQRGLARQQIERQIEHWQYSGKSAQEVFASLDEEVMRLKRHITDTSELLWSMQSAERRILFEGAQGNLLDVDNGTYPFCTSSHVGAAGVCIGAGVSPQSIGEVIAVVKAIPTRVGLGPFPTQLVDDKRQGTEFMDFVYQQAGITAEHFASLLPTEQNQIRKAAAGEFKLPDSYMYVVEHMAEVDAFLKGKLIGSGRQENMQENVQEKLVNILGSAPKKSKAEYEHILGMYAMVIGREFGGGTGRPRRIGRLDLAAIRYGKNLQGFTGLAVTKFDLLGCFHKIEICDHYEVDGEKRETLPVLQLDRAEPKYVELPGWNKNEVQGVQRFEDLPPNARACLVYIAESTKLPIYLIGTGPGREDTIVLHNPFTGKG